MNLLTRSASLLAAAALIAGCASSGPKTSAVTLSAPTEIGSALQQGTRVGLTVAPSDSISVQRNGRWDPVATNSAGTSRFLLWTLQVQDATNGHAIMPATGTLELARPNGEVLGTQTMAPMRDAAGDQQAAFSDGLADGSYVANLKVSAPILGRVEKTHNSWRDELSVSFGFSVLDGNFQAEQQVGRIRQSASSDPNAVILEASDIGNWRVESSTRDDEAIYIGPHLASKSLNAEQQWIAVRLLNDGADVSKAQAEASFSDSNFKQLQPVWTERGIRYVGAANRSSTDRIVRLRITPPDYQVIDGESNRAPEYVETTFVIPGSGGAATKSMAPARTSGTPGFAVSVGVFGSKPNVDRLLRQLDQAKLGGYSKELQRRSGTLYQVLAGPVLSQAEANDVKRRVDQRFNVNSKIVSGCVPADLPCK